MDNGRTWFFTALTAGAGVYWLVDANESVRNLLAVIAFLVFYLIGESEIDKNKQKAINARINEELRGLKSKLERLER